MFHVEHLIVSSLSKRKTPCFTWNIFLVPLSKPQKHQSCSRETSYQFCENLKIITHVSRGTSYLFPLIKTAKLSLMFHVEHLIYFPLSKLQNHHSCFTWNISSISPYQNRKNIIHVSRGTSYLFPLIKSQNYHSCFTWNISSISPYQNRKITTHVSREHLINSLNLKNTNHVSRETKPSFIFKINLICNQENNQIYPIKTI